MSDDNSASCITTTPPQSWQKPSKIPQTMALLKFCMIIIFVICKLAHIKDTKKLIKLKFCKRGAGDSNGTNIPDRRMGSFWEISLETVCVPAPGKPEQCFINSEHFRIQKSKLHRQSISQKELKSEVPESALKQFYLDTVAPWKMASVTRMRRIPNMLCPWKELSC